MFQSSRRALEILILALPLALRAAPAAPSFVTGVAVSTSQINLKWTDNSAGKASIIVERCRGTCTWYEQAAQLNPGTTSYSSTDLYAGTTYWHRLRAVDATGT